MLESERLIDPPKVSHDLNYTIKTGGVLDQVSGSSIWLSNIVETLILFCPVLVDGLESRMLPPPLESEYQQRLLSICAPQAFAILQTRLAPNTSVWATCVGILCTVLWLVHCLRADRMTGILRVPRSQEAGGVFSMSGLHGLKPNWWRRCLRIKRALSSHDFPMCKPIKRIPARNAGSDAGIPTHLSSKFRQPSRSLGA